MNIIELQWSLKEKKITKQHEAESFDALTIELKKGHSIPTHDAPYTVLITVLEGCVTFNIEGEDRIMKPEQILQLDPKEAHSLEALEDSKILVLKLKI